jgi:ketosteroid isomerase-like protein
MKRRAITMIVPCLIAGVIAGCGSSADESLAAKQAVQNYLAAFASGDSTEACAMLTDTARAYVTGMSATVGAHDCPTAFAAVHKIGGSQVATIASKTKIRHVDVNGSKAKVTLTSADGDDAVAELEKTGDSWKIASLPNS